MPGYHFQRIEAKWQNYWEREKTFRTLDFVPGRPKLYVLDMFPHRVIDRRPVMTPDKPEPDLSNPWTTNESRNVYENPWISVREDQITRPDGQPGIYGVVHFKNRAIGVLPVEDDGRVWLVGQHRYPLDTYSWEIPEGGGPLDESAESAALRELREETGLVASKIEPLGGPVHLSNSVSDEIGFLFRATGLERGPSEPEGTERLNVRCVEWSEVRAMLARGEITDSLTVIALLHEAERRARIEHHASPLMRLSWMNGRFAIVRLEPGSDVPSWAWRGGFASVSVTDEEVSVVCEAQAVPTDIEAERGWCGLKVAGPMDLAIVGVLASITKPIAEAGIPLFAISTFDTDYLLVREGSAERAEQALREAGHEVSGQAGE